MSTYGWKITWCAWADEDPDERIPVYGPRDIPPSLVERLDKGEGDRFRLYDDDGEHYYSGRIIGGVDCFEPLYDYGLPNAGCTEIRYFHNGRWIRL